MNNTLEKNILLINKPLNWTSNDVVKKIKSITKQKKVGHAGTLDPLATGLLIIGINSGTKKLNNLLLSQKEYRAEIKFGYSTKTYDSEGEVTYSIKNIPKIEQIIQILDDLKKEYLQTPPIYSAIKINGKKSYELARQNKTIELKSRKVELIDYDIIEFNDNVLKLNIIVSKGFYVRSLAHDLGILTNSAAFLSNLERTQIGDYSLNDAIRIEEIYDYWFKR